MKKRLTGIAALPFLLSLGIAFSSGCKDKKNPQDPLPPPTKRPLVNPHPDAVSAAHEIQSALPQVGVVMSQNHGHILSVSALGSWRGEDEVTPPRPLVQTQGTSSEALASALLTYFERFAKQYSIASPKQNLKLATDLTNSWINEPARSDKDPDISIRLDQMHLGLPVLGRYANGVFDPQGNLLQVVTRILPLDTDGLSADPKLDEIEAFEIAESNLDQILDPGALALLEELDWTQCKKAHRLIWIPIGTYGEETLTLAYELTLRREASQATLHVDATTGDILHARDDTPSDWHNEPTVVTATGLDEAGNSQTIPSCSKDGQLLMGYGSNKSSSRYFTNGNYLSISDAGGTNSLFYNPYANSTSGTTWNSSGVQRQSISLMRSLDIALEWWAARGWRSWDGRGSTVLGAFNARANSDGTPSNNAWGAGGFIQAGGAIYANGYSLAGDVEVIGHEFGHNVISATSLLTYANESGALNEALADLFGSALTVTSDDRFKDDKVGDIAALRDWDTPNTLGQPARYRDYFVMDWDSGGVHFNSGIINRAHYAMIHGGTYDAVRIEAAGAAFVLNLAKHVNERGRLHAETSFEEFAVKMVAHCKMTGLLAVVFGGEGREILDTTCPNIERAYRAVQILPWSERPDLAITSVEQSGRFLKITGVNQSAEPLNFADYRMQIADELGEQVPVPLRSGDFEESSNTAGYNVWDEEVGASRVISPGGEVYIYYSVPAEILASDLSNDDLYRIGQRTYRLYITPVAGAPFDAQPSNNSVSVTFAPDYVGVRPKFTTAAGTATLTPVISNGGFKRFPPGLKSVLLERAKPGEQFHPLPAGAAERVLDAYAQENFFINLWERGLLDVGPYTFPDNPNVGFDYPTHEFPSSDITTVRGGNAAPSYFEIWTDSNGDRPEWENKRQIYLLVNADASLPESNGTNNLICLNCSSTGGFTRGLVVRFPMGVDTNALFPTEYQAAAAKLPSVREDFPLIIPQYFEWQPLPIPRFASFSL